MLRWLVCVCAYEFVITIYVLWREFYTRVTPTLNLIYIMCHFLSVCVCVRNANHAKTTGSIATKA